MAGDPRLPDSRRMPRTGFDNGVLLAETPHLLSRLGPSGMRHVPSPVDQQPNGPLIVTPSRDQKISLNIKGGISQRQDLAGGKPVY